VSASSFHPVARGGARADGDIVPVEVEGRAMIVYRVGDAYHAAQRYCLHQRADLSEGIISRGFLICAAHGWRFHATTGVHEISPETCLATFAVRVVDGVIEVDPTPRRHPVPVEGASK
jgi:3-phenylpropionate/trans-cinnamate dioxygenase ferredoxin subunit